MEIIFDGGGKDQRERLKGKIFHHWGFFDGEGFTYFDRRVWRRRGGDEWINFFLYLIFFLGFLAIIAVLRAEGVWKRGGGEKMI